jgi:hypothetical protein
MENKEIKEIYEWMQEQKTKEKEFEMDLKITNKQLSGFFVGMLVGAALMALMLLS